MPGLDDTGWEASAQAWIDFVTRGDANRAHLLDRPMLERCGDVAGFQAVDVGCGEGRFCRILAAMGAIVTGIDPTEPLIRRAKQEHPEGVYLRAKAEQLPLPANSADLVVSYVALIDVPDARAGIFEMARIAKPGAKIVVANLNSFATAACRGWRKDESGNKLDYPVDRYFEERPDHIEWAGISIVNWHRPFEVYLQAFLAAELRLIHFEEPRPAAEAIYERPNLADGLRMPFFHVMEWRKDN